MACVQRDDDGCIKSQSNCSLHKISGAQQQQNTCHNRNDDDSSITPPNDTCNAIWSPNMTPLNINAKPIGWMDGLLGCMRPVMSLLVKSNVNDVKQKVEEWEIPFESITNLEWLGSGAQGTVFSGYLRNEIVAVKKVRDYKETDIKHLRRLDHENIIKFKYVFYILINCENLLFYNLLINFQFQFVFLYVFAEVYVHNRQYFASLWNFVHMDRCKIF